MEAAGAVKTCNQCRRYHVELVQPGVRSAPYNCDEYKHATIVSPGAKACAKFDPRVRKPKADVQGMLLLEESCAHSFFPPVGRGPRCHLAGDGMVCNSGHKPAQWCKPGACPDFKATS